MKLPKQYRSYGVGLAVLILLVIGAYWMRGGARNVTTAPVIEEVGLLSGLLDVPIDDATNRPSPSDTTPARELDTDETTTWLVDSDSVVARSAAKLAGVGHEGTIAVQGRLVLTADGGTGQQLQVVTGKSYMTFIMDSFDVGDMINQGLRHVFLEELKGSKFLDVQEHRFAQLVIDELVYDDPTYTLKGRLKLTDHIDTIVIEGLTMQWGEETLYVSGEVSLSRYLRGIDVMPGLIDEFVQVRFEIGLSSD